MAKAVRGKVLLAKLRADPSVRDASALAAWIGRKKKYKRLGIPDKQAGSLANTEGGDKKAREIADKKKSSSKQTKAKESAGSRREGAQKVAEDVKRRGNRRAAGRAPRQFRERQAREGSEPGQPTVSKAERNRVSKGNPNADKWAERLDVKAGQRVQVKGGGAAATGEVVGVTDNGRLRVYLDNGDERVISRSEALLLVPQRSKR